MPRRSDRPNPFKGINSKRKRLSDGSWATYWYAFKGGPRLPGAYGSAEFVEAFAAATRAKKAPPEGVMFSLLAGYQAGGDFRNLAPRTRLDYIKQIKKIEAEFGDFPISALSDRRTRGEFLAWRDRLAVASPRQADYAFTVLARVLAWSKDRGLIAINPCERGGRLYRGTRADKVWTDADEAAFLSKASRHLHLAVLLALWTGQRQGDLLKLTWFQYDGQWLRLQQGKTGSRVMVPVLAPLKAALDAVPAELRRERILLNLDGVPWTSNGFSSSFRKAQTKAGIVGVTFHDMRGTAVTRLAVAGCTIPEIATFTGHSLRDVQTILDANYLNRDPALAENVRRKIENRTQFPDRTPDRAVTSINKKPESAAKSKP